jgi:hydrogenase-4 component F
VPVSGALLLTGFLAITGVPPFGPFLSEFIILRAAFDTHHFLTAGLFLLLLSIVFIGMGSTVLTVVQGPAPETPASDGYRDTWGTTAPIVACLLMVLLLGLFIPPPLENLLRAAADFLEGKR